MPPKQPPTQEPLQGLQLPVVAVDVIRFEKNLLQIGFFGAHDTRHSTQSTRRIEQVVTRAGQRIRVAAEFRASEQMGLPSTSDRDKYIAFMKIAMEQKVKLGRIENPIRFTGYRLLKELGITFSGENYEDINRWGQRMADTTITSEQVIYMAARKRYANKTLHVFRSFQRSGESRLDGNNRIESYEVVLEDWLLENLNQSFVVPEDFNAYRSLRRPTAKGIFGYLHLWFHASHGRTVEKDYAELCMLLNIPVYRHASKIRGTMGKSLDELTEVGYLAQWDIRPMTTKEGFKLVLTPGEQLRHVLALAQRKQLDEPSLAEPAPDPEEMSASHALEERGISSAKAAALVRQFPCGPMQDQIEYAEYLIRSDRRGKLDNPAGFIIYVIENQLEVPASFMTSRRARIQQQRAAETAAGSSDLDRQMQFEDYVEAQVDQEIQQRYPGPALARRLRQIAKHNVRADIRERMSPAQQEAYALQLLRKELKDTMPLPSFESWCLEQERQGLFCNQVR